jgi:energy-coupling factor transporter ATP-binding protein EcfA2
MKSCGLTHREETTKSELKLRGNVEEQLLPYSLRSIKKNGGSLEAFSVAVAAALYLMYFDSYLKFTAFLNEGEEKVAEAVVGERVRVWSDDTMKKVNEAIACLIAGKPVILCGPSGVGKSTLARLIRQKMWDEYGIDIPIVCLDAFIAVSGKYKVVSDAQKDGCSLIQTMLRRGTPVIVTSTASRRYSSWKCIEVVRFLSDGEFMDLLRSVKAGRRLLEMILDNRDLKGNTFMSRLPGHLQELVVDKRVVWAALSVDGDGLVDNEFPHFATHLASTVYMLLAAVIEAYLKEEPITARCTGKCYILSKSGKKIWRGSTVNASHTTEVLHQSESANGPAVYKHLDKIKAAVSGNPSSTVPFNNVYGREYLANLVWFIPTQALHTDEKPMTLLRGDSKLASELPPAQVLKGILGNVAGKHRRIDALTFVTRYSRKMLNLSDTSYETLLNYSKMSNFAQRREGRGVIRQNVLAILGELNKAEEEAAKKKLAKRLAEEAAEEVRKRLADVSKP